MALTAATSISKTQVDKAGRYIRKVIKRDLPGEATDLMEAIVVILDYRGTYQSPLKKVTVGVRQFVQRESSEIIVGQRLKRLPQILDKLSRFESMRLTQMEDIGGCRAILPGGAPEVHGVLRRIRKNWDVVDIQDYVSNPKDTGYRAVHGVVLRDERMIEVQLRTPGQHEWAEAVERTAARTGFRLKDGRGPADLVEYFRRAAYAIALDERGETPGEGFDREFQNLRERVRPYFVQEGLG